MYNPKLGRFMQTDPIGYYDSMNLYQYAFNSPINYIDPSGMDAYIIFEPSGPDFAPFLGHVDLAVDMPDGTILSRGAAWGSVATPLSHPNMDSVLNYTHQEVPMRRSYIRLKEKTLKGSISGKTSDQIIREYLESGASNKLSRSYCVPYVNTGVCLAGYWYLDSNVAPHDIWIKARIAERFTDNVEVVKGGERSDNETNEGGKK